MSFIQPQFLAFFAVVCAVHWVLPGRRSRNLFLLIASWAFYGWADPRLLGLLIGVNLANYLGALAIVRWPARAGGVLAVVTVASILNLAVFKYFGWFSAEIAPRLWPRDQAEALQALKITVPLGLSFYTFHNLSYTIDVYRERIPVRRNPIDYMLFGSYFPQLVAGPIERAGAVLPQLEAERRFSVERCLSGLALALWGAFKKVVLADAIAPYVDLIFGAEHVSSGLMWAGTLGFTVQVLADFSGYTDIARGTSRMLGIELMENFNHPYLAATPAEFWQRWHISLSTWLRDYVYLPLCFSDWVRRWLKLPGTPEWGAGASSARALLFTMLVSGLWHGSTTKFLVWGLYHFIIITGYTLLQARIPRTMRRQSAWRLLTVPIMFGWTLLSMLIWRDSSLTSVVHHLSLPWAGASNEEATVTIAMLGVCAYASLPLILALAYRRWIGRWLAATPVRPLAWSLACTFMLVAIVASMRAHDGAFIYFQF